MIHFISNGVHKNEINEGIRKVFKKYEAIVNFIKQNLNGKNEIYKNLNLKKT